MPAFHTCKGRLTPYALACGYVEQKQRRAVRTRLWAEHGVYHVRAHDHHTGKRLFWDVFRTLTQARKRFDNPTR